MMLKISDGSLLLCNEKEYKTRVLNKLFPLLFRIYVDTKYAIHLKILKPSWTREFTINLCFKDTKIAGQKHSTLSNHAAERHFNPFTTEKNGAAARNVFVKRENEKRGRIIEGGVWMVLSNPSPLFFLRTTKFFGTKKICSDKG